MFESYNIAHPCHTKPEKFPYISVPAAIGATLGVLSLAGLASCLGYFLWRRKKKRSVEDEQPKSTEDSSNGAAPVAHKI